MTPTPGAAFYPEVSHIVAQLPLPETAQVLVAEFLRTLTWDECCRRVLEKALARSLREVRIFADEFVSGLYDLESLVVGNEWYRGLISDTTMDALDLFLTYRLQEEPAFMAGLERDLYEDAWTDYVPDVLVAFYQNQHLI